jgi:hypothetical protein
MPTGRQRAAEENDMNTMRKVLIAVLVGLPLGAIAGTGSDPLVAGVTITAYREAVVQIGARDNDNLTDIVIREPAAAQEGESQKETRAKSGTITRQTETQVGLRLNDVRIETTRIPSAGSPAIVESLEMRPTLDVTLELNPDAGAQQGPREPGSSPPATVKPESF